MLKENLKNRKVKLLMQFFKMLQTLYLNLCKIYIITTSLFTVFDIVFLIINGCCYYDGLYSWMFIHLIFSLMFNSVILIIMFMEYMRQSRLASDISYYIVCFVQLLFYGFAIYELIIEDKSWLYNYFIIMVSITSFELLFVLLLPIYVYYKPSEYLTVNSIV